MLTLDQVSALYHRSRRHHRSIAWTMLHNAIVGPAKIDHPYFKAFLNGFLLPCKPIGLDLTKIAGRFFGGAGEFVLLLLETRITGDYNALRLDFTDRTSAVTCAALRDAFDVLPDWSGSDFQDLFREFLEGTGLPCPSLMAELRGRFDDVVYVTLDGASDKGYRMRMFCWATTGTPHILTDGEPIERTRLLNHGTISFKTCTRVMHIPASYLLKLLTASYDDGSSEPHNAKDSIFHWLLVQILSGIGSYNMV
ncbi:hypothetical protein FB446DRAFT_654370 [Lentinula raphanica]|nr:hypothetical protein FB446DRAFT_654370 [Lentinula raphanica]